jgi:hypothetical protein
VVSGEVVDQSRSEEHPVDIRIGVIHTTKEIEVEVADDSDRDKLMDDIDTTLARPDSVLWLTDRRGKRVGVPVARVAYVEVGVASEDRRVGFGAP